MKTILNSISARLMILLLLCLPLCITVSGSLAAQEEMSDTKVSIPWNDFKQILKQLQPDTAKVAIPPILPALYVVADVAYEGRRYQERVFQFTAALSVSVLEPKRWVEIPVGRGLSIFPQVTVDGKPAATGMYENGTVYILVKGPGQHTVRYRFAVDETIASGQSSLSFPMPGQTVARLALVLDRPTYTVSANERALTHKSAGRDACVYAGGLGGGDRAYITWQQGATLVSGQQAMVIGQLNTIYSIGMGVIQVRSQINLNVIHSDIRRFSIAVPAGLDIIDLTGQAVATWESKDSAGLRMVSAYLKYNVRDNAVFFLNAEMTYPDSCSKVSLPPITLQNAARQEGFVGVGVLSNVELKPLDHSNNVLLRDKRELPDWFSDQGDVLHVYQYLSGDYRIELELTPHGNIPVLDALISSARIRSVIRDDGKMITQLDLAVRNRGEQFLRLGWNKQWQLWSVYCNNEPSRPAFDTVTGELLVPLKKSAETTAKTSARLVYLSQQRKFHAAGFQQALYPKINMPLQEICGALYIPRNIRPFIHRGNLYTPDVQEGKPWFRSVFGSVFFSATAGFRRAQYAGGYFSAKDEAAQAPFPAEPEEQERKMEVVEKKKMAQSMIRQQMAETVYDSTLLDMLAQQEGQIAQAQAGAETGLLSIPVHISFEGTWIPLSSDMLKKHEAPRLSFFYHTIPHRRPWAFSFFVFVLMLTAGITCTACLWTKPTKRKILYGMVLPAGIAWCIQRFTDTPLSVDLVLALPLIFLTYTLLQSAAQKTRERISGRRDRKKSRDSKTTTVDTPAPDKNRDHAAGADDGAGFNTSNGKRGADSNDE